MVSYNPTLDNLESGTVTQFTATLNHAGDSIQNPIVAGLGHRIVFSKHNSSETLRHVWIDSENGQRILLDSYATESPEAIILDLVSGTHTFAGDPPVRNRLHITTTNAHVWTDFYVATLPTNKILLNGYNAESSSAPLIWPFDD